MRAPRVLFVRNSRGVTDVSGAETYLMTLMEGLQRVGCVVELVCSIDARMGDTPWLQALQAREIPNRTVDVPSMISAGDWRAAAEVADRLKPDVVHAMDHRADVVAVLLSRRLGIPAVASFFGWTNWQKGSLRALLYPMIDRLVMRGLKKVIVDSEFVGRQIRSADAARQIVVIPNGVDMRRFDADTAYPDFKKRWFGKSEVTLVGTIGRVHPNKGHTDLARAAAQMLARDDTLRFVVIGEPPPGHEGYARELDAVLESTGIRDRFLVTNIPSAEIPAAIASFDVTVMPSYMESLSYVLLESMAMKTPVVATRVGGHGELIQNGVNGLLIEPGDLDAVIDALERLTRDPRLGSRLGAAGYETVKAGYSTDAMVARTCDVYREVMAR